MQFLINLGQDVEITTQGARAALSHRGGVIGDENGERLSL